MLRNPISRCVYTRGVLYTREILYTPALLVACGQGINNAIIIPIGSNNTYKLPRFFLIYRNVVYVK